MNMQHKYANAALLAALLAGAVACSDPEPVNGGGETPVGPGVEMKIGISSIGGSRAYYESPGQMQWDQLDEIGVYCLDAACSYPYNDHASYRISPWTGQATYNGDDHTYHGLFSAFENMPLTWKNETDVHDIYGAYPLSRILKAEVTSAVTSPDGATGKATTRVGYPYLGDFYDGTNFGTLGTVANPSHKFAMEYHTNQTCVVEEVQDMAPAVDDNGQAVATKTPLYAAGRTFVAKPDRRDLYMIAHNRARMVDHVVLDFYPIMTTLDITVKAGSFEVGTGIINPITITGVSVIMPVSIQNQTIEYDAQYGTIQEVDDPVWGTHEKRSENLVSPTLSSTESVFCQIINMDGEPYQQLHEGEQLRLTMVIPPFPGDDLKGTKIKVHCAEGFSFEKTITHKDGETDVNAALEHEAYITVKLPDITPSPADKHKVNAWMKNINDNILVADLSYPGYECDANDNADNITALLNQGVRAFDITAIVTSNAHTLGNHKTSNKSDFCWIAIEPIERFLLAHPEEFVFVWGSGLIHDHFEDFENGYPKANVLDWSSDLTVENTRGKIFAMYTSVNNLKKIGSLATVMKVDKKFVLNPSAFGVHDFANDETNKSRLETLMTNTCAMPGSDKYTQQGKLGIVMVKNATSKYTITDGVASWTNSDLLIDAIISCNYKFYHIHSGKTTFDQYAGTLTRNRYNEMTLVNGQSPIIGDDEKPTTQEPDEDEQGGTENGGGSGTE